MSLVTWVLMGIGVFVIYSAYKGNNPLASAAMHLGVTTRTPAKLAGKS